MKPNERNYLAGAILWLLSAQYYAAQVIAARAWPASHSYSWANNTISALGNTYCNLHIEGLACSPLHALMNVSFFVLGVTTIAGSLLLWAYLGAGRLSKTGLVFMTLSGAGTILIALFPENTVAVMHIIGAALPFIFGNLGMIMLGVSCGKLPVLLRGFSVIAGLIGLAALGLLMAHIYLGLGIGGMERVVAYPQSIWMIVVGAYLLYGYRKKT